MEMSEKNQNRPSYSPDDSPTASVDSDARLDTLLRAPSLPEPPPWFAARTLARLRNDLRARPFLLDLQLWIGRLAPRPVLAAAFSVLVLLGLAGFHLKAEHDNQQLTFDALALAAQGEAPFNDEETTWPDGAF